MLAIMVKPRIALIIAVLVVLLAINGARWFSPADPNAKRSQAPDTPLVTDGSSEDLPSSKPSKQPREPGAANESTAQRLVRRELEQINIKVIDFENTSLLEAMDFVRLKTIKRDPEMEQGGLIRRAKPSPEEIAAAEARGAALFAAVPDPESLRIKELRMRDVSAWEALQRIAAETGLKVVIGEDSYLRLVPREE